jgi:hypothetical protein
MLSTSRPHHSAQTPGWWPLASATTRRAKEALCGRCPSERLCSVATLHACGAVQSRHTGAKEDPHQLHETVGGGGLLHGRPRSGLPRTERGRVSADGIPATGASWREVLAPHMTPRLRPALLDVATSVVPYLGLMATMFLAFRISYLVVLALAIPAAGFLVRTFIVFHDCAHGSFLRSKRANATLGAVLGVVLYTPFGWWRHEHAVHHATTGRVDDRDSFAAEDFVEGGGSRAGSGSSRCPLTSVRPARWRPPAGGGSCCRSLEPDLRRPRRPGSVGRIGR